MYRDPAEKAACKDPAMAPSVIAWPGVQRDVVLCAGDLGWGVRWTNIGTMIAASTAMITMSGRSSFLTNAKLDRALIMSLASKQ